MPRTENFNTDIFCCIVVRVQFLPTVHTFKSASVSVSCGGVAAFTASLTRVLRRNLFHGYSFLLGFVFYVVEEFLEAPGVETFAGRHVFAYIGEVFEGDYVYSVFFGFFDELFGDLV